MGVDIPSVSHFENPFLPDGLGILVGLMAFQNCGEPVKDSREHDIFVSDRWPAVPLPIANRIHFFRRCTLSGPIYISSSTLNPDQYISSVVFVAVTRPSDMRIAMAEKTISITRREGTVWERSERSIKVTFPNRVKPPNENDLARPPDSRERYR
jgi:hypothetical protein